MNTLRLVLCGNPGFVPSVSIDGKLVRTSRDAAGNRICTYSTSADTVQVAVVRCFETNCRGWFFLALLFYIVGLFGILSPGYTRRCMSIDYRFDISVGAQSEAYVCFYGARDGCRAAELRTACAAAEHANCFYFDRRAKKRARLLALSRALLVIAALITAAVLFSA